MQDEIKITVVATGFTKEKEEYLDDFGNVNEINNPYTPPKFSQEESLPETPEVQRPQTSIKSREDEQLEIPAFLRKRLGRDDEE